MDAEDTRQGLLLELGSWVGHMALHPSFLPFGVYFPLCGSKPWQPPLPRVQEALPLRTHPVPCTDEHQVLWFLTVRVWGTLPSLLLCSLNQGWRKGKRWQPRAQDPGVLHILQCEEAEVGQER